MDNVLSLRGPAAGRKRRNLSDTIDEALTASRMFARAATESRSVVGTIDIATDDPGLEEADAYLKGKSDASLEIVHYCSQTSGFAVRRQRSKVKRQKRGTTH